MLRCAFSPGQMSEENLTADQPCLPAASPRSDFEAVDISLEEKNAEAARKAFKSLYANLDRRAAIFSSDFFNGARFRGRAFGQRSTEILAFSPLHQV